MQEEGLPDAVWGALCGHLHILPWRSWCEDDQGRRAEDGHYLGEGWVLEGKYKRFFIMLSYIMLSLPCGTLCFMLYASITPIWTHLHAIMLLLCRCVQIGVMEKTSPGRHWWIFGVMRLEPGRLWEPKIRLTEGWREYMLRETETTISTRQLMYD